MQILSHQKPDQDPGLKIKIRILDLQKILETPINVFLQFFLYLIVCPDKFKGVLTETLKNIKLFFCFTSVFRYDTNLFDLM